MNYKADIKDFTLSSPQIEGVCKFEGTASEFLSQNCKRHIANGKAEQAASIDTITGESFTYSEFDQCSRNVASAFYKRGMRKGDIVVYMGHDIVKLHILLNGVWKANGVLRVLYPQELEDSIFYSIMEANAKWIVCDVTEISKCFSVAQNIKTPLEIIVMEHNVNGCTSIYDLFQDGGQECPKLETNRDDVAMILNTSGTTGKCKGVVHTHKSCIRSVEKMNENFSLSQYERHLQLGKATHISTALLSTIAIVLGKTLLTMSCVTVDNLVQTLKKYQPEFLFGFPSILAALVHDERMLNMDKSHLKNILVGGYYLPPTLERKLRKIFVNLTAVDSRYGMTESAPSVSTSYRPKADSLAAKYKDLPNGSVGKILAGSSLQIRDNEGTHALGPNQQGELCMKNDTLFSCYYKNEQATNEAFTSDGWYRSGDYGHYDENGFIFITGRKNERIKCGGNHIFPASIDSVIGKHPAVADVCTVGVDDPEVNKVPRAFVTLKPGTNATAEEIIVYAHKNLPSYKYLRGGLYIVPSLPTGITGKVSRILVAEIKVPDYYWNLPTQ